MSLSGLDWLFLRNERKQFQEHITHPQRAEAVNRHPLGIYSPRWARKYTTPPPHFPAEITHSKIYTYIKTQPHTLIAGSTGSGKSVFLNNFIYILITTGGPARIVYLDTKYTEFIRYKDEPHTKFYTNTVEGSVYLLKWYAENEVKRRCEEAARKGLKESDAPPVYIIIDELSDIIFSDPQAVKYLARIAMLGRAAGVHLVASTQCPNRKTLSAEFSANCPSRVALRCESEIESRQIIDDPRATTLPRFGKCIYKYPGDDLLIADIYKFPDEEIERAVNYFKSQVEYKNPNIIN